MVSLLFFTSNNLFGQPIEEVSPLHLEFSTPGGFYDLPQTIELFCPEADAIYYTLDGRKPGKRSFKYSEPIHLEKTTVIRAIAYRGKEAIIPVSHTYLINEPETDFMVVSVNISPYTLFDPDDGLFMLGNNVVDTTWKKKGANFWSRKETSANVEIFTPEGKCVYRNFSGFRLFGGMSRLFPQKSMTIVARKQYGQKRFDYPIFGEDGKKDFKFLVLRNSGSDFGKSHFRDAFMTSLLEDWDIEKQDYQPAHVYINGDYWGVYNIREKVNRYFIEDHHDVDKDSIDLIEHRITQKRGNRYHYRKLLNFLERNSLTDAGNYAYVKSQMDVDNFLRYQIAQIYFDNRDAGGNIKFWRPQTAEGRWRWILFDTDWGFGLHDPKAYRFNSLAFHTAPDGPSWPNPPWSTLILRKLLENPVFEEAFVNRFADYLNTTFETNHVEQHIDQIYQTYLHEIPRHLDRWRLSNDRWQDEVWVMRNFARQRPMFIRQFLMDRFETGSMRPLKIDVTEGGKVLLNDNLDVTGKFEGYYFANYNIKLKAVADYGYRFVRWEGLGEVDNYRELELRLEEGGRQVRAIFEPFVHPFAGEVIINEVSPNNKRTKDWIEIYNSLDQRVNLKDWILADAKNEFRFPDVSIPPNDYLIVCEDIDKFRQVFPKSYNVIGNLDFGINKRKEKIELFSDVGAIIDHFSYDILPSDSIFTLSLLLPQLDNSDIENWEKVNGYGTPNAANPYVLESRIRIAQKQWIQVGIAFGVFIICSILLVLRFRGVF